MKNLCCQEIGTLNMCILLCFLWYISNSRYPLHQEMSLDHIQILFNLSLLYHIQKTFACSYKICSNKQCVGQNLLLFTVYVITFQGIQNSLLDTISSGAQNGRKHIIEGIKKCISAMKYIIMQISFFIAIVIESVLIAIIKFHIRIISIFLFIQQ